MKKPEELILKREELRKKFKWCEELLQSLYINFDKTKLRNQMAVMKQEIDTLTWVIDDLLPF